MDIEVGQVLWLNVRYKTKIISEVPHPMLVAVVNKEEKIIEVIAIDKARDKMHQLFSEANLFIDSESPKEKVIYVDSYAQLNNILTIEYFPGLIKYRKTKDKLSSVKLNDLLKEYNNYKNNNIIPDYRIVHMTKEEILELNNDK